MTDHDLAADLMDRLVQEKIKPHAAELPLSVLRRFRRSGACAVIRVLTVRQPWAWAIIHAAKNVENRSRSLGPYRGPVLIQASATLPGRAEFDAAADRIAAISRVRPLIVPPNQLGAIIGVADLVDVHSASVIGGCGRLRHDCPEHGTCREHCSPWADGPAPGGGWFTHLVLENPRALEQPLPWTGGLGLRRAPLLEVAGDWLCTVVEGCTCHGPVSGPHEPGCGLEPLSRLIGVSS